MEQMNVTTDSNAAASHSIVSGFVVLGPQTPSQPPSPQQPEYDDYPPAAGNNYYTGQSSPFCDFSSAAPLPVQTSLPPFSSDTPSSNSFQPTPFFGEISPSDIVRATTSRRLNSELSLNTFLREVDVDADGLYEPVSSQRRGSLHNEDVLPTLREDSDADFMYGDGGPRLTSPTAADDEALLSDPSFPLAPLRLHSTVPGFLPLFGSTPVPPPHPETSHQEPASDEAPSRILDLEQLIDDREVPVTMDDSGRPLPPLHPLIRPSAPATFGRADADSNASSVIEEPCASDTSQMSIPTTQAHGGRRRRRSELGLPSRMTSAERTGARGTAANARSGALPVRSWLRINRHGKASVVQMEKGRITARLGLHPRDLRLIDPTLGASYPAILCRERALVVNLEHIRAIITAQFVMVVNVDDPVFPFVAELKKKLSAPPLGHRGRVQLLGLTVSASDPDLHRRGMAKSGAVTERSLGGSPGGSNSPLGGGPRSLESLRTLSNVKRHLQHALLVDEFPFELRVLEVCLEQVASRLNLQVAELERYTYAALDALTGKVNVHTLEAVRRYKSRLQRLTTKVTSMREVLEKLLDDDKDMHSMNLTAREREAALEGLGIRHALKGGEADSNSSSSSSSSSSSGSSDRREFETEAVEMLLEAYFMLFDSSLNRLGALKEHIDDTEDALNLELDQHQIKLHQMGVVISGLTMFALGAMVTASIFGQNLVPGWMRVEDRWVFNVVAGGVWLLSASLLGCLGGYCYYRKLLTLTFK